MTYTEQAVKIAIENKWKDWDYMPNIVIDTSDYVNFLKDWKPVEGIHLSCILLDHLFWQALWIGKKLDSKMKWYVCPKDKDAGEFLSYKHCPQCGTELVEEVRMTQNWKAGWHRFIDHLIEGKDIESFFEQLIK